MSVLPHRYKGKGKCAVSIDVYRSDLSFTGMISCYWGQASQSGVTNYCIHVVYVHTSEPPPCVCLSGCVWAGTLSTITDCRHNICTVYNRQQIMDGTLCDWLPLGPEDFIMDGWFFLSHIIYKVHWVHLNVTPLPIYFLFLIWTSVTLWKSGKAQYLGSYSDQEQWIY